MSNSPIIYVIDIGDSLMRGGVFSNGTATEVLSFYTPRTSRDCSGEKALFEAVSTMVKKIAECQPPMEALAVSASGIMTFQPAPGIRDYGPFQDRELLVLAPNIDGLKYVPIITRLEELEFGVPIHVENDCNAALRSAVELSDAVCVNLGAGLGGAVMRNGHIEHVKGTWSCYEIGHGMRWNLPEEVTRACHCGSIGCLEAVIGGWAMTERYRTRPEDAVPDVYAHMRDEVVEFLPNAIVDVVNQSGIERVVLSGKGAVGYSKDSDFLQRIKQSVDALLPDNKAIEVDLMQLGEVAELQGVALSLLDNDVWRPAGAHMLPRSTHDGMKTDGKSVWHPAGEKA